MRLSLAYVYIITLFSGCGSPPTHEPEVSTTGEPQPIEGLELGDQFKDLEEKIQQDPHLGIAIKGVVERLISRVEIETNLGTLMALTDRECEDLVSRFPSAAKEIRAHFQSSRGLLRSDLIRLEVLNFGLSWI